MTDHEWIQDHLTNYQQGEVPPCGTGPDGCLPTLIVLGIAAVLVFFVLPYFGIFNFFDWIDKIFG